MLRNLLTNTNHLKSSATMTSLIIDEKVFSKAYLQGQANSIGEKLPFHKQELIGIFMENSAEYISSLFGVFQTYNIAFPMSILLKAGELYNLLDFTQTTLIITSKKYIPYFEQVCNINATKKLLLNFIYVEDHLPHISSTSLKRKENNHTSLLFSINHPLLFLATSGTTGNPKIVQLSERNLMTSVIGYGKTMLFQDDFIHHYKLFLNLPFSSSYGMFILLSCLYYSIPLVISKEDFSLQNFYSMVENYQITHYEGASLLLNLMELYVGRSHIHDISSLKYVSTGGTKVNEALLKTLSKSYPRIGFYQGYGMTEASPLITRPNVAPYHHANYYHKLNSVGTAIEDVAIFIKENKEISQNPFTTGEILVKSPGIMIGYYRNEALTKEIYRDGYLYTGDIGYLDELGYLYIIGRSKNIIIVNGFNIHPEEVEMKLIESEEVIEAYVYPHITYFGEEELWADVIFKNASSSLQSIYDYLKTHITSYKVPKNIRRVENIMKGSTGKIIRS